MNETTELIRYDAMVFAIAECHRVDEVKELRDKARALEVYAQQAQNVEAERKATEIRLRAEARAGELFKELRRSTPSESGKASAAARLNVSNDAIRSPYDEALRSTGISKQTAHRYEALADVPKDKFERHLKDPTAKPTTSGILRAANGSPRMDDGSLWVWGRLRDFERDGHLERDAAVVFGGMTEAMQADVRRILPSLLDWLNELHWVSQ